MLSSNIRIVKSKISVEFFPLKLKKKDISNVLIKLNCVTLKGETSLSFHVKKDVYFR